MMFDLNSLTKIAFIAGLSIMIIPGITLALTHLSREGKISKAVSRILGGRAYFIIVGIGFVLSVAGIIGRFIITNMVA